MGRYVFKRFLPNLRGGYVNLFQELPALLSKMLRRMVSRGMYEDSKGCYWVSVADGVGRLDPKTGKVGNVE